jgi:hypothetical protein
MDDVVRHARTGQPRRRCAPPPASSRARSQPPVEFEADRATAAERRHVVRRAECRWSA